MWGFWSVHHPSFSSACLRKRSYSPVRPVRGPYLECVWLPESNCSPNSYGSKRQAKRETNQICASPKMTPKAGVVYLLESQAQFGKDSTCTQAVLSTRGRKKHCLMSSRRQERNSNPKYAFRCRNLKLFSFSPLSTQPTAFLKGSFPASEQ